MQSTNHSSIRRRTLTTSAAWAVPVVVTGALAPAATASPPCPTTSPISVTNALIVLGGATAGQFNYTMTNPAATVYTVVDWRMEVAQGQSIPRRLLGPYLPADPTVTFDASAPMVLTAGAPLQGTGNITPYTSRYATYNPDGSLATAGMYLHRVVYRIIGDGLPAAGCEFSFNLTGSGHGQ